MTDFNKLAAFTLQAGKHNDPKDGLCAMEAVAWLEGLDHTDTPACTDDTIGNFVRYMNDQLPYGERQKLIPYLPRLVGTNTEDNEILSARRQYLVRQAINVIVPNAIFGKNGLKTAAIVLADLDPFNKEGVANARAFLNATLPTPGDIHVTVAHLYLATLFNNLQMEFVEFQGMSFLYFGMGGTIISDPLLLWETLDGLLAIGQPSPGFSGETRERVDAYLALMSN